MCVLKVGSMHVETVVLLSQRKADNHIEVDLDLDGLDVTSYFYSKMYYHLVYISNTYMAHLIRIISVSFLLYFLYTHYTLYMHSMRKHVNWTDLFHLIAHLLGTFSHSFG